MSVKHVSNSKRKRARRDKRLELYSGSWQLYLTSRSLPGYALFSIQYIFKKQWDKVQNKLSVFANEKKVVSTNFDPFSKEVLSLYIYICTYIHDISSTRNSQSGRGTLKEVLLRTATAIFPFSSLPRLTVVRARGRIVNRPRALPHAHGSRVRANAPRLTRSLARSLARHRRTVRGRWRVTTTSQDVVIVGHQ